jgi:deazaflavin-dependent oxidoreductase (nitroreductase family)
MRFGPRLAYALGLGPLFGRVILLLTTTGRKSGKPQVTPLTYEERDGTIFIASARGRVADWVRNIAADPHVSVRLGRRRFLALGEIVTEIRPMADYLQRQLERNPKLFGRIMRMEGLPEIPTRSHLESLAAKRTLVVLQPEENKRQVDRARSL